MTPTEKHRADAARVFLDIVRDAPCEGIDGGACWSATVAGKIIASALAKSEREGMKRAAEIAKAHYDARHAALARAHGMNIATAILSQAGEGE